MQPATSASNASLGSADKCRLYVLLDEFSNRPQPGEDVAHIARFAGPVHALRFSPDGRFLAAGGEDETGHGEIRLWDGQLPRSCDEFVTSATGRLHAVESDR